jgi:hypothetical protein
MNSEDFFYKPEPDGEKMVTKWFETSGIYVIENPLFKYKGKRIFKIGMSGDGQGIGGRMTNYRTAYGVIPFKIHLLWAVSNPGNYSINFVKKTETAIHNTLIEYDEDLWAGARATEWFCDLSTIMNVILTLRDDYIVDMPAHINVSNWKLFVHQRLGRIKKGIRTSEREMDILKGISTNSLTDVKVLTQKEKKKRLRKKPTQVDTFKPGK